MGKKLNGIFPLNFVPNTNTTNVQYVRVKMDTSCEFHQNERNKEITSPVYAMVVTRNRNKYVIRRISYTFEENCARRLG
jgi:hypothetical protein